MHVLVVATRDELASELGALLPAHFAVHACRPGSGFFDRARTVRPHIAVLDRFDERPAAAQIELEVLKDVRRDVRILAVSGHSTPQDASLLEGGVFYYTTEARGPQLRPVIEAAAKDIQARAKKQVESQ